MENNNKMSGFSPVCYAHVSRPDLRLAENNNKISGSETTPTYWAQDKNPGRK
ncbi:hypothetical protein TRIP_C21124 [Candidatus Zixiibacteriota bacterium]|nr:hypothetical protein TRIP_C21124 [candidate division Zixibacteria bacterium]